MHDGHNIFDEFYANFASEWGVDESMERNFQESKEVSIVVGVETSGIGVDPSGN